jgi:hypothetical protein
MLNDTFCRLYSADERLGSLKLAVLTSFSLLSMHLVLRHAVSFVPAFFVSDGPIYNTFYAFLIKNEGII